MPGDHLPVPPYDPWDLRAWLHKADEDLAAAEQLLATDSFMVRSAVAFHAQQCVEKGLKALLVARGVDFDRSHDLGYLLHRLESYGGIPSDWDVGLIDDLTDYAVLQRYPGDSSPVTAEEATAAVVIARTVRTSIDALPECAGPAAPQG